MFVRGWWWSVVAAGGMFHAGAARADLSDPSLLAQLNPLEQLAAKANQAVYNALTAPTTGGSATAAGAPICGANQAAPGGSCNGQVWLIFQQVRELVDTANALEGTNGQTLYSLGLDAHGLGQALRWTAAEELSAQGRSSTEFSNGQFNVLGNRLAALRFGARGFRVAGNNVEKGGSAGADDPSLASPWGGFIDTSYDYGRKGDTTNSSGYEDAFAFDGTEISGGVDYRFSPHFVLGAMLGYTSKRIDFDSSESTTDGRIRSSGASLMAYGLWEADAFYASGSVGWQRLNHDFVRRITYPSQNPTVPSVDDTATSNTSSGALLATFGLGYDARYKAFTAEPYLKAEYQKIKVNSFTESGANGFDFNYGDQNITSLDSALGVKFEYVFSAPFGVIVPYVRGELHKQFEDKQRQISAVYAALATVGLQNAAGANFDIPDDERKDNYGLVGAGLSLVLKHGWQVFAQYQQVIGLTTIADRNFTGGFRYEF